MTRVSIGMPVYNGERYLREAIDAHLAQTFRDFELVISDNASTDTTPDICRAYAERDARVRYCPAETNVGAAANFNRAFALGTAEYFKWAAHDDLCEPTLLERCVAVLDAEPDVVVAFPKARVIDQDGNDIGLYAYDVNADSASPAARFKAVLRGHKCFEQFGVIRRREMAETSLMGGFAHGDGVFLAQLALRGRLVEIPEPLFLPRRHGEQSMTMLGEQDGDWNPDYQAFSIWFNPALKGRMLFPFWRIGWEYFRSLAGVRLAPRERLLCLKTLVGWHYQHRQWLTRDITGQLKRRFSS